MKTKLETNNIPQCTIYLVKTSTKTHNISLFLFKIFQRNMSPKPRKLSHRYATEVDFEIYDMGLRGHYMADDYFIPNPPLLALNNLILELILEYIPILYLYL